MRSYGTLGKDAVSAGGLPEFKMHTKKSKCGIASSQQITYPMTVPRTLDMRMVAGISLVFSALCASLVVYERKHDDARVQVCSFHPAAVPER